MAHRIADTAFRSKPSGNRYPRRVGSEHVRIAARVRALAEERNVPLHEDPNLARVLTLMEGGAPVPSAALAAVAEALALLYRHDPARSTCGSNLA
ncbi:MAG: EscU/YscU/HrcU family type III secretion system export apparatus switch protein [Geminicoccaceae bacterium]|nr:EscU/YscU/HrcU family type III secretion system export apparatus switch protein [Geminicoccaceae bacterium]